MNSLSKDTTVKRGSENKPPEDADSNTGQKNQEVENDRLVTNNDHQNKTIEDGLRVAFAENENQLAGDEECAPNSESTNQAAENTDLESAQTERTTSNHFNNIPAIIKQYGLTGLSVFRVPVEVVYMHNISVSPEFFVEDVCWSCIIFPNGIGKNKVHFIDLGFQIKSYSIQNPKRHIVYTVSILSKGIEHFRRETKPFYLKPRGQKADGYMIAVEDFGDKEVLGDLIDDMGEIKIRVEMDIKLDLTLLEQTKRFFGWVHIKWMLCRGNAEEWNRAMLLLDEEHRRVAESFRVISTITSLETEQLQRQTEHFAALLTCIAELNAIAPENVIGDGQRTG